MEFFFDKLAESQQEQQKVDFSKLERPERLKAKFYKYSGIAPGRKLVDDDIRENWEPFNRVMLEEGATKPELFKVLLNKYYDSF